MAEKKSPTMHCVICGAILVDGICRDHELHWKHMSPEEIRGALEELQEALVAIVDVITEMVSMVSKDD